MGTGGGCGAGGGVSFDNSETDAVPSFLAESGCGGNLERCFLVATSGGLGAAFGLSRDELEDDDEAVPLRRGRSVPLLLAETGGATVGGGPSVACLLARSGGTSFGGDGFGECLGAWPNDRFLDGGAEAC